MSSMFNVGTTTLGTGTLNSITKAANSVNSTLTKAMNSALGTVNSVANSTVSAVNSVANSTVSAVNSAATTTVSAMNSVIPSANSLSPFNSPGKNITKNNSNSGSNNFKNVFNNSGKNIAANSSAATSPWAIMFGVLLFLLSTFLIAMFVFKDEFDIAWNYLTVSFRKAFNMKAPTNETPEEHAAANASAVTTSMPTSLDTAAANSTSTSLLNKLLPMGTKEVFNVSTNDYTYYDAEPLCLALGAELATYDQVQEAWDKGGDWCNYGWAKGQLAIYPTQKETWNKLQNGQPDEKNACGRPGVNGGYFDNPEMRFGVNCYGIKPDQSANDERLLMENGTIPKTATTLKVDKQIASIKENLDMVGILPFSSGKWSA